MVCRVVFMIRVHGMAWHGAARPDCLSLLSLLPRRGSEVGKLVLYPSENVNGCVHTLPRLGSEVMLPVCPRDLTRVAARFIWGA